MENRVYVFVICLLSTIGSLYSQDKLEHRYGFRIGANYSAIRSDDISSDLDEARIGAVVGFFAEYRLHKNWSIQPELHYSAQGNRDQSLRLNYIQLPVLIRINFSEFFHVHFGPQGGFKLWEWERNEVFSDLEFSVVGGIGVNIAPNLFFDLRYGYGISNIFEEVEGLDVTPEGNGTYGQLTFGYRL